MIMRLPETTNSFSCRWFWTLLLLSTSTIIFSIICMPGAVPIIGLTTGTFVITVILSMRDFKTHSQTTIAALKDRYKWKQF